jgi:hypothetical protein
MNFLIKQFKVLLSIIILFLILDVTIGKYLYKKFIKKQLVDVDQSFGLRDDTYDHKFSKNYNSIIGWGNARYKLCTDDNGFRIHCKKMNINLKEFDIAFIGDSFTEGLGYDYENTFIGLIEDNLKEKKIANLAMTSYSTSIYFSKINQLIKTGYKFNEVIVFLDISDFPDDILCYSIKDNKVIRKKNYGNCYNNFNAKANLYSTFFEKNFKFTLFLVDSIYQNKKSKNKVFKDILNNSRSEWTYSYNKNNFKGLEFNKAILVPLNNMAKLHELLSENSIDLSVAVYPWPGTLKNDNVNNKQVEIWKKFCLNRCKKFYNFMPILFSKVDKNNFYSSYKDLFIINDVHFNSNGHRIIANEFLSQYKK